MQDRDLVCAGCGQAFPFSASEQAYYAERGFQEPKRCRSCRQSRKRGAPRRGRAPGPGGGRSSGSQRVQRVEARRTYPAVCVACGADIGVPFAPRETTIRCGDCFRAHHAQAS